MENTDFASVWARVIGASAADEGVCRREPEPASLSAAKALCSLAGGEKQSVMTLRALLRFSLPSERGALCSIISDDASHFGRLCAEYCVLTGDCRAKCCGSAPPNCESFCAYLRSLYLQKCKTAEAYRDAAGKYGAQSELFLSFAEAEAAHAKTLLCLLSRRMARI